MQILSSQREASLRLDSRVAGAPSHETIYAFADNPFDLQVGGNIVGPVPLEKYEPGVYTVKLKITDNVAKKDVLRELSFEVK